MADATPALLKTKTINFEGEEYTLQADAVNSIEFLEAMRADDILGIVILSISEAGYTRLKAQLRDPQTGFCPIDRLREFMEALMTDEGPTNAS